MKRNQFLLMKLMEECSEVAQRASKQIQFGKLETQNGQGKTNGERLKDEILDLMAIVKMLELSNEIPVVGLQEYSEACVAKQFKLNKYLKMSNELGELPEITI